MAISSTRLAPYSTTKPRNRRLIRDITARMQQKAELIAAALTAGALSGAIVIGTIWLLDVLGYRQ